MNHLQGEKNIFPCKYPGKQDISQQEKDAFNNRIMIG